MLVTVLNFSATLSGLIAAGRWYQATTISPPAHLSLGESLVDAEPIVSFVREIAFLNRRAASWTAVAALLEGLAALAPLVGL